MSAAIIILLCSLLLLAYLFDLTSSKTKIPSVILLLILGWLVQQGVIFFNLNIPDLSSILPILGTIGLILIVLEGSLELEFNRTKISLIKKSIVIALIPILALSFLFAFLFMYYSGTSFKDSLLNAIPFSVISSSIAIPSVKEQINTNREFIIYESSLSDIIGILFFNFIAYNTIINLAAFGYFGMELVIMTIISFIATIGLSYLLGKIDHHIKFVPIVILIILVYEVSKIFQLPALLFILLFGLFLGNLDEMKHLKWIHKLKTNELDVEIQKFKELIIEATFLVRTVFFILFGFLMKTAEILNKGTLIWALLIVISIIIFRALLLKLFKLPLMPLLFIAPRGLINILLFLSILPINNIEFVNKSLVVQVILLTAIIMMAGLLFNKKNIITPIEEKDAQPLNTVN